MPKKEFKNEFKKGEGMLDDEDRAAPPRELLLEISAGGAVVITWVTTPVGLRGKPVTCEENSPLAMDQRTLRGLRTYARKVWEHMDALAAEREVDVTRWCKVGAPLPQRVRAGRLLHEAYKADWAARRLDFVDYKDMEEVAEKAMKED